MTSMTELQLYTFCRSLLKISALVIEAMHGPQVVSSAVIRPVRFRSVLVNVLPRWTQPANLVYDSRVLTEDTGVMRGLPIDGNQGKAENMELKLN